MLQHTIPFLEWLQKPVLNPETPVFGGFEVQRMTVFASTQLSKFGLWSGREGLRLQRWGFRVQGVGFGLQALSFRAQQGLGICSFSSMSSKRKMSMVTLGN